MTHVSLFTGVGGADLAAEWAGFETVLQVEREPFALEVLEKHWPDVPRITDVREVHDDERWTEPTVISGGFPCQPFSAAGKRRGADDDRYLWPELLRIVEELQPRWVIGENVSGLLSIRDGMEIDDMLASLEAANYEPWVLHYPAAGVGAPHKRDRVFIVAHRNSRGRLGKQSVHRTGSSKASFERLCSDVANTNGLRMERERPEQQTAGISGKGEDVANADYTRPQGGQEAGNIGGERPWGDEQSQRCAHSIGATWESEPAVDRVANGIPRRVDRLKALGNAIVPQQIYPIFAAIAEAELYD